MPTSSTVDEILRPLKLTPQETEVLTQQAKRLVSETLAASELFIANDHQLPKSEWKHMKTKEHVQVYRSRKGKRSAATKGDSISSSSNSSTTTATDCSNSTDRPRSNTPGETATSQRPAGKSSSSDSSSRSSASCDSSSNSSSDFTAEINKTKTVDLPLVIATGIVPGTVEDVAFGALAYTERITRLRDTHVQEKYKGVKVLATIVRPTAQDPFQSLTVKWTCKNVSALSRTRDRVFIEANGIATDSSGKKVAYHLIHSIDSIARIPGLKHLDIMRVNMSVCYVSRQYDQSSVDVFCRGFLDPGGNLAESIAVSGFTNFMLSVVHFVDCAYTKKLLVLAHKKLQSASHVSVHSTASHCSYCASSLTVFGSLIQTGTTCQSCRQEICNKCSVTKKVAVEVSSAETKLTSVIYCLHCVIEATKSSTREAAVVIMELFDPQWSGTQRG